MNIKLVAAGIALAVSVPPAAVAQEEWVSKQQAGWQPVQPQDGAAAAMVWRSVLIDEGNTPVRFDTAGRSRPGEVVQDSADDPRNRPALDMAGLYFGG